MSTVAFKVFRFDPERAAKPNYDTYKVPLTEDLTVLDSLYYIQENYDGSLAFRSSCRRAMCGSCGLKINGKSELACHTLVKDLESLEVTVEPLSFLPVVKDLIVDMTKLNEACKDSISSLPAELTMKQMEISRKEGIKIG